MRMMGAESVAYHRATVLERGDDFPGRALAYLASRGETPLVWGGAGAARLGMSGAVSAEGYEAVFGPGGARHPATGERLVSSRRPGMELVISAHKSVAELGVIGRAEDLHKIMDAERDATLDYLESVTKTGGGRRGRAAIPAPTSGLVYAVTRHATSRAGDPCPHDHVLIANVIEMLDSTGGWKAATTALWREHLHAATQIGRVAAAAKAVELGYGIVADEGRSGRLRHWRIAGVPEEILALHSKRAGEITAAVEARGTDTYQARNTAARSTRAAKRHVPEGELVARWRGELASIGWSPERLEASITAAAGSRIVAEPSLTELHRVLGVLLADDGPLARQKVFARRHVLVELAPLVYGWQPRLVDGVAARVLADPEVIPLVGVGGAVEPAHALASVIAREEVIAERIAAGLERSDAPVAAPETVVGAVALSEGRVGGELAVEQREAVEAICSSGRGVELIVGVAGAGKTTMLAAVAAAFEASGCEVLGTATAGQAARTLAEGAALGRSSTLASLTGSLERHQLQLTDRSVVILDEAGMTDDIDLARLVTQVQLAGAKLIVVGDHRQLGAVGPGGSLTALVARHPDAVHHLVENRRQTDRGERDALEHLRDGDIGRAVDWYAGQGRIRPVAGRDDALQAAVDGWAADTAAGAETALLAWRQANVAELNGRARAWMAETGQLSGPELDVDGIAYRAGDRVVALTPDRGAGLVTSQRAMVTTVDPDTGSLVVRTEDDRQVTLGAGQLGPDRVGHAYATTVHRFQGSTVDRAHLYADGGGRELAYVAMSRARHASSVYLVADDLAQAREDLARDWATRRTPTWAIDTALPTPEHLVSNPQTVGERERAGIVALRHAHDRLLAAATRPGPPPGPPEQAETARGALVQARQDLAELAETANLAETAGAYKTGPIRDAARHADTAGAWLAELGHAARAGGWRERRQARSDLPTATATATAAEDRLAHLVAAERGRLDQELSRLQATLHDLDRQAAAAGQRWQQAASQHATATRDQERLGRALRVARRRLEQPEQPVRATPRRRTPGNWQPAHRHVVEPEPPEATHEVPGL
jgi:conjugative relaxase-like TrwC/TraI family protein